MESFAPFFKIFFASLLFAPALVRFVAMLLVRKNLSEIGIAKDDVWRVSFFLMNPFSSGWIKICDQKNNLFIISLRFKIFSWWFLIITGGLVVSLSGHFLIQANVINGLSQQIEVQSEQILRLKKLQSNR